MDTASTYCQYATNGRFGKSDPEEYPAPILSNMLTGLFTGLTGLIKTAHKVSTGDLNVDVPATKENFEKVTNVFSDFMKVKHNFSEASNYRKEHARLAPHFKETKITPDKEENSFALQTRSSAQIKLNKNTLK